MKTIIVLCPTLQRAFYMCHRLAVMYPDMWINMHRKNPMSLTSITGTKYIFIPENKMDRLLGFNTDIISIDEFEQFGPERSEKSE